MRIAFLCNKDPYNFNHHSGIPFSMRCELEKLAEVVTIGPAVTHSRSWSYWKQSGKSLARQLIPSSALPLVHRIRSRFDASVNAQQSDEVHRRLLQAAARTSASLAQRVETARVDAVVACFSSELLYAFLTDIPIVYYTDTTYQLISSTYPKFKAKSAGYQIARNELERTAMHRSAAAAFATELARQSAIVDYGMPAERTHVVPMGANVLPNESSTNGLERELPSRRSLRLCITAANPVRKGLDLAIDVVELLRERGWNAQLSFVGPPTSRACRSRAVTCVGRLKLAHERDRLRHQQILAQSHLMILPSQAEAFGIAPAEAAHQGTPSIVSAAGGLPEVVLDNLTGLVMPLDASPVEYADRIESLIQSPNDYRAMCNAALQRARAVLSWSQCAQRIMQLLEQAVTQRHCTQAKDTPRGESPSQHAALHHTAHSHATIRVGGEAR